MGLDTTGQRFLTATGKWEGWVGKENLAFCSGISLLFFENYKRGLLRSRSVVLSKHVTHYGPLPSCHYNNIADPQREGFPYPPPEVRTGSALWEEPWRPHRFCHVECGFHGHQNNVQQFMFWGILYM